MRPALGHVYTISRHLADRLRPPPVPAGVPFTVNTEDPRLGQVALSGLLHPGDVAAPLVVLVHGLGGSIDSGYIRRMAAAACHRGYAVLRLNLRGADRSGLDIYHAGLTDDLRAALASPALAGYQRRVVVGYSLGGNMTLRFAGESPGDLAAVVAVCAPLDLAAGARHIDSPSRALYCRHLLRGLRDIYGRSVASIGTIVGTTIEEMGTFRSIRVWDERIVARRFGFRDADDYYRNATALPLLDSIEAPTLMVRATADPMISTEAAALSFARRAEVWRLGGGHIGFPASAQLDLRILDWLDAKLET